MVYPGGEKNYTTDIVKMTMKGDNKKADQILISFNISLKFLQSVPLLAHRKQSAPTALPSPTLGAPPVSVLAAVISQ